MSYIILLPWLVRKLLVQVAKPIHFHFEQQLVVVVARRTFTPNQEDLGALKEMISFFLKMHQL